MAGEKVRLLQSADCRLRFLETDGEEILDGLEALIQRNLQQLNQKGGFVELNTLRPREQIQLKVKQTSDRLLAKKHDAKVLIKVKSYRVRLEELEQKIEGYRSNTQDLRRRVKQYRVEMLEQASGGPLVADFRQKVSAQHINLLILARAAGRPVQLPISESMNRMHAKLDALEKRVCMCLQVLWACGSLGVSCLGHPGCSSTEFNPDFKDRNDTLFASRK